MKNLMDIKKETIEILQTIGNNQSTKDSQDLILQMSSFNQNRQSGKRQFFMIQLELKDHLEKLRGVKNSLQTCFETLEKQINDLDQNYKTEIEGLIHIQEVKNRTSQ